MGGACAREEGNKGGQQPACAAQCQSFAEVWDTFTKAHGSPPPGKQPPPMLDGEVDREVGQATSSVAWSLGSDEALTGSCSEEASSDAWARGSGRCFCAVVMGSEVTLAHNYEEVADALEGNLEPGCVGIVNAIDPQNGLYSVHCADETWWYKREALITAKCTQPKLCSGLCSDLAPDSRESLLRCACVRSTAVADVAWRRWNALQTQTDYSSSRSSG
eukprot:TRINITY_DN158_c0_g1_i2.p1 TRINITY_DN158_c0_g1~~TRINITY_DN158_c0_g1_i2.p1  ORF type:complete len:218 (-),score=14.64 TRINITY_DN158_c0_g1_i2:449-1102(-)